LSYWPRKSDKREKIQEESKKLPLSTNLIFTLLYLSSLLFALLLFYYFRDYAGTDSTATFANRKTQTFFHRNRRNQTDRHLHIVTRHHHLRALR